MNQSLEQKTLADLEWERIVAAVAERCQGPQTETLKALPLAQSFDEADLWQRQSAESLAMQIESEPLPLEGIREISQELTRLQRHGALDGSSLRKVASTLGAARVLRLFLSRNRASCPALYERCSTDPTLDQLQQTLQRLVEPDGTLSDGASETLGSLRAEVSHLRARIISRLEHLLHKHEDILQDTFHTLREGRYVVPVRTDAHERLPGIVHGTSKSGASVFVEPKAIVQQGNRLKMAQAELEREVARILAALSAQVSEHLPVIEAAVEALDLADLRSASARLAKDLNVPIAKLCPQPKISLKAARHPLLVLAGVDVVPNDLSLKGGDALVFSGPNAGGKTVALKLLGLSALMVRAGLPVPAEAGSEAGFFCPVLSDIGDEQSLAKNLSTFSAHVQNLVSVIDLAGPETLVLLDEVATGTDPEEGAALACAVIEGLLDRQAAVAVTTHYDTLKAMAVTESRVRNASVGFDVERMAPTYRVRLDLPGNSSALAVARRFGMPEFVLRRAQGVMPDQAQAFDTLVRQLEAREVSLRHEQEALRDDREAARAARAASERALARIEERDRKTLGVESEKLLSELKDARSVLRQARKALRKKDSLDDRALEQVRKQLQTVSHAAEVAGANTSRGARKRPTATAEPTPALLESDISVGQKVWSTGLSSAVSVVEGPHKGKVRVAAGPMKMWVKLQELAPISSDRNGPASRERPAQASPRGPTRVYWPPGNDNTLDVRGMNVEDALSMTESFLDQMYGASEKMAYVLHGIGTGALRDAIRKHLAYLEHYVSSSRPGSVDEGGERLTAIVLK